MNNKINSVFAIVLILVVALICGISILGYSASYLSHIVPVSTTIPLVSKKSSNNQITSVSTDQQSNNTPDINKSGNNKIFFDANFQSDEKNIKFSYPSALFTIGNNNSSDKFGFGSNFSLGTGPNYDGIFLIRLTVEPAAGRTLSIINNSLSRDTPGFHKSMFVHLADDPQTPLTAIRYEYIGDKQSPSGYGYEFLKKDLFYQIEFDYNTPEAYTFDGLGNKIADLYDPIGDNIAMTIRFLK